jgi:hypothetical protein
MEPIRAGELVKIVADGREDDAIVFDTPSATKVVVAVVDRRRGPLFRTVHPQALAERSEAGPDDAALRRLLRRTSLPAHPHGRAGAGAWHGRAGHTRPPTHRATGR